MTVSSGSVTRMAAVAPKIPPSRPARGRRCAALGARGPGPAQSGHKARSLSPSAERAGAERGTPSGKALTKGGSPLQTPPLPGICEQGASRFGEPSLPPHNIAQSSWLQGGQEPCADCRGAFLSAGAGAPPALPRVKWGSWAVKSDHRPIPHPGDPQLEAAHRCVPQGWLDFPQLVNSLLSGMLKRSQGTLGRNCTEPHVN